MRTCSTLLLVIVMLATFRDAAAGQEPAALESLIERAEPAVVTIVAYNPELAMPSISTGFFIAPRRVVGARHALVGDDRVEVRTHDGKTYRVSGLAASDAAGDLAIIALESTSPADTPTLAVSKEPPHPGERLFAVGSPLGLEWSASEGIVSAVRDIPDVGTVIQHTVPTSIGSSGCPLMNFRGEVVAIQTAILTAGQKTISAGQGLNFASPVSRLAALKPGEPRPLANCIGELAGDWVAPITKGIDGLALYPLTRDDFKSSLAFFLDCTRREPAEPDAWFRLGLCKEKIGDRDGAQEAYAKAIELKPPSPVPYNNLGVLEIQKGNYHQAISLLEQAVKMRPAYTEAFSGLAVAHFQLKNYSAAIDAARQALRTNANHSESHFTLGKAYLNLDQRDKAMEQYNALVTLDRPKADELKSLIDAPAEKKE